MVRTKEQPFTLGAFLLLLSLPLRANAMFNSFLNNLAILWACTEETPYMIFPSMTCSDYVICVFGVTSVQKCPPGQVFHRRAHTCVWPTREDVKRCYKNLDGYTRASCPRNSALKLPVPDSCALYIDCNQAPATPEVQDGHVLECPYPSLFSVDARTCVDFRQGEQHCRGRPVPKSPCDYLQYRQISPVPAVCVRRHPSCVGKRDGVLPVKVSQTSGYFVKCFRERTVDAYSCVKSEGGTSSNTRYGFSCNRLVYND